MSDDPIGKSLPGEVLLMLHALEESITGSVNLVHRQLEDLDAAAGGGQNFRRVMLLLLLSQAVGYGREQGFDRKALWLMMGEVLDADQAHDEELERGGGDRGQG